MELSQDIINNVSKNLENRWMLLLEKIVVI